MTRKKPDPYLIGGSGPWLGCRFAQDSPDYPRTHRIRVEGAAVTIELLDGDHLMVDSGGTVTVRARISTPVASGTVTVRIREVK